jgi:hypothetical protein
MVRFDKTLFDWRLSEFLPCLFYGLETVAILDTKDALWYQISSLPGGHTMRLPISLLLCVFSLSCAPILATTAISRAEKERDTAIAMGADTLSPYEFTKGELLLNFAKDKQGFSDFYNARELAEEAQRLFAEAKRKAPQNEKLKRLRETLYKKETRQ